MSPWKIPRLPLVAPAFAAAAGIWIADCFSPDPQMLVVLAAAGVFFALRRGWSPPLWLAVACVFGAAHMWQSRESSARIWADAVTAQPRAARVTGVLTDEPVSSGAAGDGKIRRGRMRTESWNFGGIETPFVTEIMVRWTSDESPRYGDRWSIEGAVLRPEGARNPGEFDAADWLARQGVFLEIQGTSGDSVLLARGAGSPIKAAALAMRSQMLQILGVGIEDSPGIRALVAGITLGTREAASDEFADAFRQTGTFHLFSVSGLHVGMFALLLWMLLRPLGFTRRRSVLLIVPLLFFYSLVTGASAPSLRAAIMISVALGGFLMDRPNTPANSLAAAALLLLAWDTEQLFLPGFQLSFFIVASIFLLAPPLRDFLAARLRPDPFLPRKLYGRRQKFAAAAGRELSATLSVSTAAWLGSLPLTALVFHLVPIFAIPANLLSVPLAFAILAVAMLSLIAGSFSLWLAAVFNNANWGLASLLLAVVQGAAAIPGAYVYAPPGWLQPPARLTVFDVGTGGAQLLRTRRAAWLFDTGSRSDFKRIVEPGLRMAGVGRLDALLVTHGDAGHAGGGILCLENARPRTVMDSALRDRSPTRRALQDALRAGGWPKSIVFPGDFRRIGTDVAAHILFPSPQDAARLADDQAVVVALDVGGFRVLLMSDSGIITEEALLRENPDDLRSDILVLGGHGRDIFGTENFLNAVRPQMIVLARDDPFREGGGGQNLRERLRALDVKFFDQSETGAVVVTFDGKRAEARGFLNGKTVEIHPR